MGLGFAMSLSFTFDCLDHSTFITYSLSVEGLLSSGKYIYIYF